MTASGRCGTPLAQRLGPSDGLGMLFVGLSLLVGATAVGAEIHSASEEEMASALVGCWEQERTRQDIHFAKQGYFNKRGLCFGTSNVVKASWVGVDPLGTESGEIEGYFRLKGGKLHLNGGGFYKASCDVVMRPHLAVQFRNCVDGNGSPFGNLSYFRVSE